MTTSRRRFAGGTGWIASLRSVARPLALAAMLGAPVVVRAQGTPAPFSVGEELTFRASFAGIGAGSARMRVAGIDTVRGRPAYHLVFTIDGGVPLFRVHDRYESWMDVETLSSLRHTQQIAEGRYRRTTSYEIYPELARYRKDADTLVASVSNPLDDGSFIYAVRASGVRVGETRREDRYFRPDRNPVVLTGLRHDTVTVAGERFAAIVIAPTIRTKGLFAEGGSAQVWFSDDAHRYPLLVKSKFASFSLTLALESIVPGVGPEIAARVARPR